MRRKKQFIVFFFLIPPHIVLALTLICFTPPFLSSLTFSQRQKKTAEEEKFCLPHLDMSANLSNFCQSENLCAEKEYLNGKSYFVPFLLVFRKYLFCPRALFGLSPIVPAKQSFRQNYLNTNCSFFFVVSLFIWRATYSMYKSYLYELKHLSIILPRLFVVYKLDKA